MAVAVERINPGRMIKNAVSGLEDAATRVRSFIAPQTLPISELHLATPQSITRNFTGGREQPATIGSDFMFGGFLFDTKKMVEVAQAYPDFTTPANERFLDKADKAFNKACVKTFTRFVAKEDRQEFKANMKRAKTVRETFEVLGNYDIQAGMVKEANSLANGGKDKMAGFALHLKEQINGIDNLAAKVGLASVIPVGTLQDIIKMVPPEQTGDPDNPIYELMKMMVENPTRVIWYSLLVGAAYGAVGGVVGVYELWKHDRHDKEKWNQAYEQVETQLTNQHLPNDHADIIAQLGGEFHGHFGLRAAFTKLRSTAAKDMAQWVVFGSYSTFLFNYISERMSYGGKLDISELTVLIFGILGGAYLGYKAILPYFAEGNGHGGHH